MLSSYDASDLIIDIYHMTFIIILSNILHNISDLVCEICAISRIIVLRGNIEVSTIMEQ